MTALIFASTYAVVAVGRVPGLPWLDRSRAAVLGAALMIAAGAIGPREALAAIDRTTIALLLVLAALVAAAGLLSALFVNDTICVAFTPLVLELAALRRHDPLPYLLALATASNIGSVATIVGNPQNMLIGSLSHVGVVRFTTTLAPVAAGGLAIDAVVLWLLFRPQLVEHPADHRVLAASAAADGARRVTPAAVLRAVDWRLLLLFAGLFVVVGAGERQGLDRRLFALLAPLGIATIGGLSATAVVLSNAISNVPAVMLFTRVVPRLPRPERAWLALAMASTLAGNLTIVGSIANLIVIEGARRRGVRVRFGEYLRVGVPVTLATLAFGVWWLSRPT